MLCDRVRKTQSSRRQGLGQEGGRMSGMASLRKDTGIHILKDELGWPDKGGKNGYKKSHSGGEGGGIM